MGGNPFNSTDVNHRTSNGEPENGDDGQLKLAPLPPRAYFKQPHGDPLSFQEEIICSGDDFSTEAEMDSAQSVIVQDSLGSRFHGESSLFTFANALSERWKFTGSCGLGSRRREFWETPEVRPSSI